MVAARKASYIVRFKDLGRNDVPLVGGKNASLGEMIGALSKQGVRVPGGFATTARAYREYVEFNRLGPVMDRCLRAYRKGKASLNATGGAIRRAFLKGAFPPPMEEAIAEAYRELCGIEGAREVAVRSSATAEDLPAASFAGQQESFLNIRGEAAVIEATRRCLASLFTNRAISYREEKGFDHLRVALSVGIQRMVRSDLAGAGVMFSIDTESGFPRVVIIDAAWGLGESVVQGIVDPDEYVVFKPLLRQRGKKPIVEKRRGAKQTKMVYSRSGGTGTRSIKTRVGERSAFVLRDDEILDLARTACRIEEHYGCPMDIEWAKDGKSGELFIVQARPETVQSQLGQSRVPARIKTYRLKQAGKELLSGIAIGNAIATGRARRIRNLKDGARFCTGEVLVAEMTDPDWVPLMRRAAAIITDHGGRTCHAAIVSRELGLPAIIGTGNATRLLRNGAEITVSCAEGETGRVYEGVADFDLRETDLRRLSPTRTGVMMNLANPAAAFRWWRLPADGVGLARMEFIINNLIKIHPMALVRFDRVKDGEARRRIRELTRGYAERGEYFVTHLAEGIAKLAAAQYPNPVILRMSDFKTNEYANLIGGADFEPTEDNPMLGFRGASRYYNDAYRPGFELECRAVRRVREEMGFENVIVMIPFCRTLEEADRVLGVMAQQGLRRGRKGLEIYVMCEIPSNVILAEEFAERFDGFSIGSNDLTQLVLGVDRDSEILAPLFDERNEAVRRMIRSVITAAHKKGRKVGFCGQAPSDNPAYAAFLVEAGIDSVSVSPDSLIGVKRRVASAEKRRARRRPPKPQAN
jgi:pyruvate,water dikinase